MSSFPRHRSHPASHTAQAATRNPVTESSSARRSLSERWLLWRATVAFARANIRYWPSVAPRVSVELDRWEQAARSIPNPTLRAIALGKLREEHLNAQSAATLAILAPSEHRGTVARAIVALQVMYDYLDALSEQPGSDIADGECLFAALTDSLAIGQEPSANYYRNHSDSGDGGYLRTLRDTIASTIGQLPATEAIRPVAQASAQRCAGAQILNHASSVSGTDDLKRWAISEASATGLQWQEFLAGACASVLAIHALIAAAAIDETTPAKGALIDSMYLRIGAVSMLDSLVDYEQDKDSGQLGYLDLYGGEHALLAVRLQSVVRGALKSAYLTPDGPHHVMTLAGVVAHYSSAISNPEDPARCTIRLICKELRPVIFPALALMRAWRVAKRLRRSPSMLIGVQR